LIACLWEWQKQGSECTFKVDSDTRIKGAEAIDTM
jgi:hypothetical protein